MEKTIIEAIVQGGAVGLAAFALYIVHFALKAIINHIPHITEAMVRVADVLQRLVEDVERHERRR